MDMPTSKACTKCGTVKALDEFYRNKKYKDGCQAACKVCDLADQKARREAKPKKPKFKPDAIDPVNNKVCSSCKTEKSKSEFNKSSTKDGFDPRCRSCLKANRDKKADVLREKARIRYQENREELLQKQKEYYKNNRESRLEYLRKWVKSNEDKVIKNRKKRYDKHGEEIKKASKDYYHKNRESRVEYRREYVKNNYEKSRISDRASWQNHKYKRMEKIKQKYRTDVNFKLRRKMNGILTESVKRYGLKKTRTLKDLPYTPKELRARLEVQFKPGMSWDNYGEWHIDHKIPITWFLSKGERRQHIINALSNLQPLWAEDNFKKGNRWIG